MSDDNINDEINVTVLVIIMWIIICPILLYLQLPPNTITLNNLTEGFICFAIGIMLILFIKFINYAKRKFE